MFCNKCGNKLPDGSLFCLYCGNDLSAFVNAVPNNFPQSDLDWASDVENVSARDSLNEWLGEYGSPKRRTEIEDDVKADEKKSSKKREKRASKGKNGKRKPTGAFRVAGRVLLSVFFAFSVLLALSLRWAISKWAELTVDEIMFQLSHSLKGTGSDFIISYLLWCILPTVVLTTALVVFLIIFHKKNKFVERMVAYTVPLLSVFIIVVSMLVANKQFGVTDYLKSNSQSSDFIGNAYVDPNNVKLTFPKKKRNLIYIFVESLEITFSDEAHGGGFKEDVIPELTDLAATGDNFSENSNLLNGGHSLPGSHYTMAAIVAQTMGLPIKSIGNQMGTQESFYGNITNIGDILARENYKQVFMLGSDASFGGRKLYFTEHGNYEIDDYIEARKKGIIPQDYKEWWGYEDEKMFAWAKDKATELASSDQPFNLTLLTADTHFEDGYICGLCRDDFGDNQYANVYACADRQIVDFVKWVQQQDFYEDTTIVISGDHPTMDKDFCNDVSPEYDRRVYTLYINSAADRTAAVGKRSYSTFDNFPTTLAAMGVDIQGNKLGLGVNLYSEEQTYIEQMGLSSVREELKKNSDFMDSIQQFELNEALIRAYVTVQPYYHPEWNAIRYYVFYELSNDLLDLDRIIIRGKDESNHVLESEVKLYRDNAYQGNLSMSGFDDGIIDIQVLAIAKDGSETLLDEVMQDKTLMSNSLEGYLKNLNDNKDKYDIFITSWGYTTKGMSDEDLKGLEELGLDTKQLKNNATMICAAIEGDKVTQETDIKTISIEGTLSDGTSYDIACEDPQFDAQCNIVIDGTEYARNYSGLNFVVYDPANKRVVDRSVYSVSKRYTADVDITAGKSGHIHVSNIGPGSIARLTIKYGEKDGNMESVDVKPDDNNEYDVSVNLSKYDESKLTVIIDGYDELGRQHRINYGEDSGDSDEEAENIAELENDLPGEPE